MPSPTGEATINQAKAIIRWEKDEKERISFLEEQKYPRIHVKLNYLSEKVSLFVFRTFLNI